MTLAPALALAPHRKTYLYIHPAPAGDQSGSSWANAAPLSAINSLIAKARTIGADILLRADAGSYYNNASISISQGGTAARRVTIRGATVTGAPAMAEITGGRASPWSAGAAAGAEVFRLNAGSDHLGFSFLRFRNQGSGCIRVRQSLVDLLVTDCEAYNVCRFFENLAITTSASASITGLTIQRIAGHGFSKNFIRIQYDSTNILVEDVVADSERQDGDNFATGISFYGNASHAVLNRCVIRNIVDTLHAYQNGDGYSGERGNNYITLNQCEAYNCTDGGVDFKGDHIVLNDFVGVENHRNIRLWGLATINNPTLRNPKDNAGFNKYGRAQISTFYCSHVQVFGGTITQASDDNSAPFRAETGALLCLSPATLAGTVKPSSAPLYSIEAANNGDPAGRIEIMDATDTTLPTIVSPANYAINENKFGAWPITATKTSQMRVVSGDPALALYGSELRMARQDYEAPAHPDNVLRARLVAHDVNGHVSAPQDVCVFIGNVNDNAIAPAELFNATNGATDGAWWDVSRLDTLFQDVDATIPAQFDAPVARINDLSGKGHHARQSNPDQQAILRTDGARVWLEFDGIDDSYVAGEPGAFRFPQVSAWMMQRRDPVDTATRVLFAVPRAASTSFNGAWWLAVIGGASMQIRIGGTNRTSNGVGGNLNSDRVLGLQSVAGEGRSNEELVISAPGVPVQTFTASFTSGLARIGADGNGEQNFMGRWYGGIISNRNEDAILRFRIARQLADLGGVVL